MFQESLVALITPMHNDGSIDFAALHHLVQWHIKSGTNAIVPVGTTGESPVLSEQEHQDVISETIKAAKGNIAVMAGCGSNNTAEALRFHQHAFNSGAQASLHVTGYYNKPSQAGLIQHFGALNASNSLPIVVYNVPPRTNSTISIDTMGQLAQMEHVIGVKDATQDLTRPFYERWKIGQQFNLLSGEDISAPAYNAAGGDGCISVTANVAPKHCAQMQAACTQGDFGKAFDIQQQLMPLHHALFLEPSPAGIKYACSRIGLCGDTIRLPLTQLTPASKEKIDEALTQLELL